MGLAVRQISCLKGANLFGGVENKLTVVIKVEMSRTPALLARFLWTGWRYAGRFSSDV